MIFFNHAGFLPEQPKYLVTSVTSVKMPSFDILDAVSGEVIYTGHLEDFIGDLGRFMVGDFSDFNKPGRYILRVGSEKSPVFSIRTNIWDDAIWKSCHYFSIQRCGNSKTGYNSPCHLDDGVIWSRWVIPNRWEHKDVTGGWHDACDVRKWTHSTIFGVIGLGNVKRILNPSWDRDNIIFDEIKWGNQYFLKMQDEDGYLYDYCGGDDGNYFTDNMIGTVDDRRIHVDRAPLTTQYNFMAAQALIYQLYRDLDASYAEKCIRASIKCFDYCETNMEPTTFQELGVGVHAAVELFRATQDQKFKSFAVRKAEDLMKLQVKDYIGRQTEIKGFFYNDASKRAFVQSGYLDALAIIGLCVLCETFPEDPESAKWKETLQLYFKSYIAPIAARNAFGLIPYGVYLDDPGGSRKIGDLYYRYFGVVPSDAPPYPAWRRYSPGNNSNCLGHGVALAKASAILGDSDLQKLAWCQLSWVVGCNPFAASTVSGVGFNQPPIFVTSEYVPPTPVIEGAVMNGIGGTIDDKPFILPGSWSHCEYWTPHVCFFLWVISELTKKKEK